MGACASKGGAAASRASRAPVEHNAPKEIESGGVSPMVDSPDTHTGSDGESERWPDSDAAASEGRRRTEEGTNIDAPARAPSRLQQHERRRLSVSTVHAGEVDAAAAAKLASSGRTNSTSAQPPTNNGVPAIPIDMSGRRRSSLVKFDDPAMELVDRSKGSIKQVTLQMLHELFPEAMEHYAVFGSPAKDIQRGFDNKIQETDGFIPVGKTLCDIGVGFACKKGLKPESPNQDDFFILRVDDWAIYGVFDGHGPYGHDVSAFVHKTLPFLIISDPLFEDDLPTALRRAFRKVHHLVEAAAESSDSTFECTLSGSTGTVVVQRDGKLTVAHVGDSRSVLGQKVGSGKFKAIGLTQDHKPTRPEEKSRIQSCGGEVRRLEGDIPFRVFVKNRMYPGLAMSRAIGDTVGAAVGVIADPDIKVHDITDSDHFLCICTDGVWEFITSQTAVDFIGKKSRKQVQEAADLLAYESWRRWVEEEENVVDDVTCIIIHLK